MNEIEKTTNKKKLIFGIIGVIVLIVLAICFVIALINHKSGNSSNSSSSSSSSTTTYTAGQKITAGGTYKITGENSCIVINSTDDVTLELDNATITCENGPAINVESGKVEIVLTGENTITSTTTESYDGAIYSKDDLTFSGDGSLKITSNYDGIVSKDDLVITSGTYTINATDD